MENEICFFGASVTEQKDGFAKYVSQKTKR